MYKCNFTYLIKTIFSENVIFTMSYLCLKVFTHCVNICEVYKHSDPRSAVLGYFPLFWLSTLIKLRSAQTKIALSSNLVYKLPPKMVGRGRTSTCYKELFYGTRLRVLLSVHTFSRDTNDTAENSYRNTVAKVLSPKKVIVTL